LNCCSENPKNPLTIPEKYKKSVALTRYTSGEPEVSHAFERTLTTV